MIGASVGIAVVPPEGGDANQLIKNADLALYDAKRAGRGCHRFHGEAAKEMADSAASGL
jgi:predicted signal transduction protein with EAL and GGDEF domain